MDSGWLGPVILGIITKQEKYKKKKERNMRDPLILFFLVSG